MRKYLNKTNIMLKFKLNIEIICKYFLKIRLNFRRVSYSVKMKGVLLIWYVLCCEEGNEWKAAELLGQRYGCPGQEKVFLITFEKMKRYKGVWHCQEEALLRGCVFAEADSQDRLENAANATAKFRISGGAYSQRLMENEQDFLWDISGESHRIPMSKGYIKNGVTIVTEGPLCGKERQICKIDRHKRLARIESPLECYRNRGLWMGLEIVEKS